MISYGFTKDSDLPFDKVREAVAEGLKKEGFGILTEIDLQEKFKEKLGVDFKRYVILGACSPPNAYKSVQAEENIGLMLPCNVIVYERGGRMVLSVVRPTVAMQMIDNAELKSVAELVEKKLKNVFDAIP